MRQLVVDPAAQPIRNLSPNPSSETSNLMTSANLATVTRLTTGGLFGSAHARASVNVIGTGFYVGPFQSGIAATSGQIYTASVYVRSNRALAGVQVGIEPRLSGGGSAGATQLGAEITLTPNVWQRISFTTSALPASTASVTMTAYCVGVGVTWASGDYIDTDGWMITEGATLYDYADGDSFGWRWTGVAHESISVGYLDPPSYVRNLSWNTKPVSASGWAGPGVTFVPAGPGGVAAVQVTSPGDSTPYVFSRPAVRGFNTGDRVGVRVRLAFDNVPAGGGWFQLNIRSRDLTYHVRGPVEPMPAAGVSITRTLSGTLASAVLSGQLCAYVPMFATSAGTGILPVGVNCYMSQVVIDYGDLADVYVDGDTPGWRWTGVANNSESIGYPYTLERITGTPFASHLVPSTTTWADSPTLGSLPPLQGRTLITVYDVFDTLNPGYPVTASWTAPGSSTVGLLMQHTPGGTTSGLRVDTEGGVNQTAGIAGVRTAGRHVAALRVDDGITSARLLVDNSAITKTLTPGTGIDWSTGSKITHGNGGFGVATYVFDRALDDDTCRRAMAWLVRRYGTVAARNVVPWAIAAGMQNAWTHVADAALATMSVVSDPVTGTSLTSAVDIQIAAATRSYSSLQYRHNQPIKSGERWTVSFYARRTSQTTGSDGMNVSLRRPDYSNPVLADEWIALPSDLTWTRIVRTFIAAENAAADNALWAALPNGSSNAASVRFTGIQFERGDGTALPFQFPI